MGERKNTEHFGSTMIKKTEVIDLVENTESTTSAVTMSQLEQQLQANNHERDQRQLRSQHSRMQKTIKNTSETPENAEQTSRRHSVTEQPEISNRQQISGKRVPEISVKPSGAENSCGDTVAVLQERAAKLERECTSLMQDKEEIERENVTLKRESDSRKQDAKSRNKYIKDLEKLLLETQTDYQLKLAKAEKDREKLTGQLADARQKAEEREKDVRNATAAALTLMKQKKNNALPEEHVLEKFSLMSKAWRSWAKSSAKKNWDDVKKLQSKEKKALWEHFRVYCGQGKIPEDFRQSKKPNTLAGILLTTLISHHICEEIFLQPLAFLNSLPSGAQHEAGRAPSATSEMGDFAHFLYGMVKDVHRQEAEHWRSRLLQLLAAPAKWEDGTENLAFEKLQHARIVWYRNVLSSFWSTTPAKLLVDWKADTDQSVRRELFNLIKEAGEFATLLWTQRTVLQVDGLQALPNTFNNDSPYMTPHASQQSHAEHLNGCAIGILINPAIAVYGNAKGEDYDGKPRVWLKATVWLKGTATKLKKHGITGRK